MTITEQLQNVICRRLVFSESLISLAEELGVTASQIARFLKGEQDLRGETIDILAKKLGLVLAEKKTGKIAMDDTPDTLIEAVRYFADESVCQSYMRKIKWPDGKITCPHCEASGDRIGEVKTRNLLRCKDCRKSFSHKGGTIFEDSPLPLGHWFVAVWCIANCKNGISSRELAGALWVAQKTAWFMLHRIRKAMEVGGIDKFDGPAEADTSYIGGKAANMHKHKR